MFLNTLSYGLELQAYKALDYIQVDLTSQIAKKFEQLREYTGIEKKTAYIALSCIAHLGGMILGGYLPAKVKVAVILCYAVLDASDLLHPEAATIYDKILRGIGRGLLIGGFISFLLHLYQMQLTRSLFILFSLSTTAVQESVENAGSNDFGSQVIASFSGLDSMASAEVRRSLTPQSTPGRNSRIPTPANSRPHTPLLSPDRPSRMSFPSLRL